ncbi:MULTISPECIES: HK97-gp10 family putative phage morphogenesis protein [unclassified Sphingopyxis]|uniref:HK97-gp10 family putative phage morphogenesis protein n=1 Tax=unclassified Sphingopyxis TaxID=2614943 RepID=UPI0012E3307C|nr:MULTISPECIES: HK97-gp10 family putative phage morphogenesis protein [unclassified Sphingopyxis]
MALKGINGLKRRIGSVKRAIENDLFEDAGSEWVEQDFKPVAKAECPVGETGDLQESIDGAVNQNQIRVYASAPYASYVHDGTAKIEANPFLQRAFERTRPKLSARMRQKLRDANR